MDSFILFPHVVDVSALSICIVLRAFVVMISMCSLYVSLGSRVSPSIVGLIFIGKVMLSFCNSSCVLYSTGSGVKRVHVVFSVLRLFVCGCQVSNKNNMANNVVIIIIRVCKVFDVFV